MSPMGHSAVDIERLSTEARLELIGNLWDSLRKQPDAVPVPEAHRAELDRRLDELEAGHAELVTWEDAKRRMGIQGE